MSSKRFVMSLHEPNYVDVIISNYNIVCCTFTSLANEFMLICPKPKVPSAGDFGVYVT